MKSHTIIAGLVLAVGSAAATAPGSATTASNDLPSREVRYADLNLAEAAGVAQLQRRIRHAARQVCGSPYSRQPMSETVPAAKCAAEAIAAAQADVQLAIAKRGKTRLAARTIGVPGTR